MTTIGIFWTFFFFPNSNLARNDHNWNLLEISQNLRFHVNRDYNFKEENSRILFQEKKQFVKLAAANPPPFKPT